MSLSANPGKVAFFQSLPDAVRQAAVLLKLWSCGAAANEVCRVYENAAERRWPVTDCKLKITGYPLSILAAAVCAANKDAGLDSHACRILADVLAILASQVSKPVLVLRNGTTTFADGGATAMQVFHQMGVRRQTVLGACILVQDAFYDHLFFKVGPMPLDKIRRRPHCLHTFPHSHPAQNHLVNVTVCLKGAFVQCIKFRRSLSMMDDQMGSWLMMLVATRAPPIMGC